MQPPGWKGYKNSLMSFIKWQNGNLAEINYRMVSEASITETFKIQNKTIQRKEGREKKSKTKTKKHQAFIHEEEYFSIYHSCCAWLFISLGMFILIFIYMVFYPVHCKIYLLYVNKENILYNKSDTRKVVFCGWEVLFIFSIFTNIVGGYTQHKEKDLNIKKEKFKYYSMYS